jgi:diguanylate cyclase (GGDEF)-like protein
MEENTPLEPLTSNLSTIEYLRDQLVYVKWDRETFLLLDQSLTDTLHLVKDQYGFERIDELVSQLQTQVKACLGTGKLPQEAARTGLLESLANLCRALPQADVESIILPNKRNERNAHIGEIRLLGGEQVTALIPELESAGFQVRHLTTSGEARALLNQDLPGALVVDMDFPEGEMFASFNMIAEPNHAQKNPLFFISERGDLAARMTAVGAGGSAYFTKPVRAATLLERLNNQLLQEAVRGQRILIVDDTPAEAQRMAHILENKGIIAQVLDQPMEIIHALNSFQPDFLLLNLELAAVDGVELATAIRQYEPYESQPMIMFCAATNLEKYAKTLGALGDDLLSKGLPVDYLLSTITHRLRRAQSLHSRLKYLNQRDSVSGLPNRRFLMDQLARIFRSARTHSVALMLITLDNARDVEARGVGAIDDLVGQASQRLQKALGSNHQAIRFGAAVFAVLNYLADQQALQETAHKLRTALETADYPVTGAAVRLRTSIGISIATPDEEDYARLIQHADLACRVARERKQQRIHIFDVETDQEATQAQQKRRLAEVKEAMQQQRMELVFQPIVSLQGDQAARYEVLLRMRNKEGWELLPETVFGVAQHGRLGIVLERWIIANTIRLLRRRQQQSQPLTLFVKVSPAILQDADFAEWLRTGLGKTGSLYGNLVFEITEPTARQHLDAVHQFVNVVKGLGFNLALDRFAGRTASRALMEELSVDYVKLDTRFIDGLTNDEEKQQHLKTLIQDLEHLKIIPIVGSIDNLPTLYALWSCGVNYVQGFALQQPQSEMNYDFAGEVL